jgi:hypothetical protein
MRGVGCFKLGDVVKVGDRRGKIVEVVKFGMYPERWKGLRVRGYYREHESYIVEMQDGTHRWPRVGAITKVRK